MDNNNLQTQNSSGMMNGMPPETVVPKKERKLGPIIGVLVIVIVLIIAGLYFFGKKLNTEAPIDTQTETMASDQTSAAVTSTSSTSSNDDVDSISADLDAQLQDVDYSF